VGQPLKFPVLQWAGFSPDCRFALGWTSARPDLELGLVQTFQQRECFVELKPPLHFWNLGSLNSYRPKTYDISNILNISDKIEYNHNSTH
jgi:hypothetical protein